jgi:hypothetical protein
MTRRNYLYVCGFIFGLIGIAHIVRAIARTPISAGAWEFPVWLSWGGLLFLALSIWGFRLARRESHRPTRHPNAD